MTLQASGPISIGDLQAEYGASSLGDLYRNGAYVTVAPYTLITADDTIPTSGPISLSNFYGTALQATTQTVSWATTGAHTFTWPSGIDTLTVTLVGAGGGGSSESFCGDGFSGGAGGTGGYYSSYSLTRAAAGANYGDTMTVNVGAGGTGGPYPGTCAGHNSGTAGGNTDIVNASSTTVLQATGGSPGTAPGVYPSPGYGGSGGTPNGVNGPGGGRLPYVPAGPTNGTGYGSGGQGDSGNGGNGYASITW